MTDGPTDPAAMDEAMVEGVRRLGDIRAAFARHALDKAWTTAEIVTAIGNAIYMIHREHGLSHDEAAQAIRAGEEK